MSCMPLSSAGGVCVGMGAMGALPRVSGVIPGEAVQSCRVADCSRARDVPTLQ